MARDIEDGLLLLVGAGFNEHEILHEWPYDRFQLLKRAARRRELEQRRAFIEDVALAVSGVMGNKGFRQAVQDIDERIEYDL